MTFLALVLALLLEQWRPLRTGNALYAAFARYVNQLAHSLNAGQYRDGVISWALAVLPAVLIVVIVHLLSRQLSWITVLLWNVAVLYLALGFRQFSHFYTDVAAALRAADATRARAVIAAWRGGAAGELTSGEIARVAIEQGLLRSHRHVFGVIVWFVLLGAAGAIIYRLAALLHDRWAGAPDVARDDGGAFGLFAERAFQWMDWLPPAISWAPSSAGAVRRRPGPCGHRAYCLHPRRVRSASNSAACCIRTAASNTAPNSGTARTSTSRAWRRPPA